MSNDEDVWFQFCKTEEELKKTAKKVFKAKLLDADATRHFMKRMREIKRRKLRVVYVPREFVFNLFCEITFGGRIARVELEEGPLPDDVHVVEVAYSHERGAFAFLVRSRRFEPVPLGEIVPPLITSCRVVYKEAVQ